MIDKNNAIRENERAVLVGVVQKEQKEHEVKDYLDELQFLAETAGAITVKRFYQKLAHPDSKTFVGKGKLQEIATYVDGKEIDLPLIEGRRMRLFVCTATGEARHETTWRKLAAGADAFIFLADNRVDRANDDAAALKTLRRVMDLEGLPEASTPMVVAFNRRSDGPRDIDQTVRRLHQLGQPRLA